MMLESIYFTSSEKKSVTTSTFLCFIKQLLSDQDSSYIEIIRPFPSCNVEFLNSRFYTALYTHANWDVQHQNFNDVDACSWVQVRNKRDTWMSQRFYLMLMLPQVISRNSSRESFKKALELQFMTKIRISAILSAYFSTFSIKLYFPNFVRPFVRSYLLWGVKFPGFCVMFYFPKKFVHEICQSDSIVYSALVLPRNDTSDTVF
jgi:hypothetical protein